MTGPRTGSIRRKISKKKNFDLDEILEPLGGFGKFQFLNFLQIAVIITLASETEIGYVFTASELKHRCLIPECDVNGAYNQSWLPQAIPTNTDGTFRECERYHMSSYGGSCANSTYNGNIEKCSLFVYDTEEWTIAREDWGIHCDEDKWMLTLIGSINNAGLVVGSLYVGFLCDRFGRKLVILYMSLIVIIVGTIKSFAVNYAMFAVFEFLEASLEGGLYTLPFVLALEIVNDSKRVWAGVLVACAYPTGEMIFGFVQWLTLDWRTTLQIVRLPYLAIVIFFWTLPESVRWLVSKRRNEQAVEVLRKIARMNGRDLSDDVVQQVLQNDSGKVVHEMDKKAEYIGVAKSKKLRIRFLAVILVWIANTFIFFGLNLSSVNINDDKFLNSILTCAIEIPSYLSSAFAMTTIGRRYTQSTSLFLCSVGCLLFAFVPKDWAWAQLLLFLLGKYGIAVSFITIDVYTTELFPTGVRASAISTGHMIGRIAAILAPQTPLLSDFYQPLPLLLFSAIAAIGGCFAYTLPETLHAKLPDTVKEAETLGNKDEPIKT